jgi:hypothetical protein
MSYIVSSPGRCGSLYLARYLFEYDLLQDKDTEFKHIDFDYDNTDLEKNVNLLNQNNLIIHTHDIKSLLHDINFNVKKIIIIRRNPVEIAVSYYVAEETDTYHFYHFNQKYIDPQEYIEKFKDVKFTIDQPRFLRRLKHVLDWYIDADKLNNTIIFNYKQAINTDIINQKLNLTQIDTSTQVLPIEQPFDKWNHIEHADFIKKIGSEIFNHYQFKFPHIFPKEDFVVDLQA